MIKSIIVDDELKSRESLKTLLLDFCEGVSVEESCDSVDSGIKAILEHKPDVLFLDIQLQGETGFDLLSKLDKIDFEIIFTTAYSEYALKALKLSALDYLLKPINISELNQAIKKVKSKKSENLPDQLGLLLSALNTSNDKSNKIALPTPKGYTFVEIDSILYCEASSNYTKFSMKDGKKHLVSKTLKEFEDILTEHNFYRIHNSSLVNLNEIKEYVRGDGGYVVMSNDVSLDVSKRKKDGFLNRWRI